MNLSKTVRMISESFKTEEEKPRLNKRVVKRKPMNSSDLLPAAPGTTVNALLYSLD